MTWILIIGAIASWILYRYLSETSNDSTKVQNQGGMKRKYSYLINYLLEGDPHCRIISETNTTITLSTSNNVGSTTFYLQQVGNYINIQYKVENRMFGNHNLQWNFEEDMPQDLMATRMESDTQKYIMTMMGSI